MAQEAEKLKLEANKLFKGQAWGFVIVFIVRDV